MLTIARLFGKSPFAPLQTHMSKVAICMGKMPLLFEAIKKGEVDCAEKIAQEISQLEHEADLTKNDIRNHLPKSLFLPVDRGALLEILSLQDACADQAEAIGHLAAVRSLPLPLFSSEHFNAFCQKNLEAFWIARNVVKELDELLESSFGGIEAEKVKGMIEEVAFLEHEADLQKRALLKDLYRLEEPISIALFHLSLQLIEQIGRLSHIAEKLGNRIRMLLEIK